MDSMKRIIAVARGLEPADCCITNAKIVDVFNKEFFSSDILICDGKIAGYSGLNYPAAKTVIDAEGKILAPGLIDSHVHIESSHLSPDKFAELIVPLGTTTIIADPHEITNVCGIKGIDYILDSSAGLPLSVYVMFPSCVPATPFEHSGANLNAKDIKDYIDSIPQNKNRSRILGLGEMMNYPGVIFADENTLSKINVVKEKNMIIDGHSPMLLNADLDAYVSTGVKTDHECSTPEELLQRIRRGMYVLMRQGSACHNVVSLVKAVNNQNVRRCLFCTDDRQPKSILSEGHINNNIRLAISSGLDPIDAITCATINAAECYHLTDRGAIAPGYKADMILIDDLSTMNVSTVIVDGVIVAKDGKYMNPKTQSCSIESVCGMMDVKDYKKERLQLHLKNSSVRVIEVIPGEIVTKASEAKVSLTEDNIWKRDEQDIVKVAVIERHHGTGNIGLGLLKNYGLKDGAIALTVAHDSHNIIVAGDNDTDMDVAVNELIKIGGGMVVVKGGVILDSLALPIAGLMTTSDGSEVDKRLEKLHKIAQEALSIHKSVDPFMTLCFMSLPVIPEYKLTDIGLFDVRKFDFVSINADE